MRCHLITANTQVYDPRADYIAKNKPMVSTGVKTKSTPPTETTTNYSIIMNPMVT
jgi:hypothetical protein